MTLQRDRPREALLESFSSEEEIVRQQCVSTVRGLCG